VRGLNGREFRNAQPAEAWDAHCPVSPEHTMRDALAQEVVGAQSEKISRLVCAIA